MASASISQVHRAVLLDGRIVALKVRRPEIAKVVQADLDIIKNLAQLVERRLPNLAVYRPLSLAREFERTIKRELDFSTERRTMQRCRLQFAGDPTAHIPLVFEELSTPSVIAMEFIEGVSIDDLDGIRRMDAVPDEVAVTGARILLRQIFEFGFFHADPHPGNLRVLPGGVIAPLDYGMFGQLDGRTRERIAGLLERAARAGRRPRDPGPGIARYPGRTARLPRLSPRRRRAGRVLLRADARHDRPVAPASRAGGVIRTHHLHIPPDLVLLIRSLVTIEAVGRNLDPHFDIASAALPVHSRPVAAPLSPRSHLEPDRADHRRPSAHRHALARPAQPVARIDQARRAAGSFRPAGLRADGPAVDPASNSLTVGIVIAGLFVASSLVLRVGSATLAYVGFATGLVLCLWLVWNMSHD